VPGGTYFRTYTNSGTGATGLADSATVSGFRLDKYLVTVGRFRQFLNALFPPDGGAGWLPAAGDGKHTHLNGGNGLNATTGDYEPGWIATDDSNIAPTDANLVLCSDWTPSAGTQENLPIDCVNWYESYAFCIWDGGFLPSEAEWEYAAAGGNRQLEYPWGATDPGTGSAYAIYSCYYPPGSVDCTGLKIAPVGTATLGAGLWGQLDLVGDLWEWTLDDTGNGAYADPCTDCTNTMTNYSHSRVRRGGSFVDIEKNLLMRNQASATERQFGGLRCARSP